jgi:oligo-1,6-glucosidase
MILRTTRDNARTPIQWDDGPNAGFTSGEPWLKVNGNASEINVNADLDSEESIFQYYQKLIELRKTSGALIDGEFERIPAPPDVFVFKRVTENETLIAACSLSKHSRALFKPVKGEIIIGNYFKETQEINLKVLRPYEAALIRI